jgi:nitrate reductase NapE component
LLIRTCSGKIVTILFVGVISVKDEKDHFLADEEDQNFRRKFRIISFVILVFGAVMSILSLSHVIGNGWLKIWMLLVLLGIVMFLLLRSELVKHFQPEDTKENVFGMKYIDFDQIRKRIKEEETGAPQAPNIVTVSATFANIRSGGENDFPIVTIVKKGDKLILLGESGEWLNIRLENGMEGWIDNKFARK